MNGSLNRAVPTRETAIRRAARILSVLILLFWGFFIIAHIFGDEGFAPVPLKASDYVGLITMAAWLLGLAVAWKKEFIGGLITLIAFAIAAVNDSNVLSFPILLVPITAVLFLAGWWMRRVRLGRIAGQGTSAEGEA